MRNKTRLIGIALSIHKAASVSPSQEQKLQRLQSIWVWLGWRCRESGEEVDGLREAQSGVYCEEMKEHGS